MAKAKTKKQNTESDGVYMLKLVLYMILGAQWIRITKSGTQIPIPYGFLIGLFFAGHDHFQIDRKIEYALLLVSMFVGFWLPVGYEIVIR